MKIVIPRVGDVVLERLGNVGTQTGKYCALDCAEKSYFCGYD